MITAIWSVKGASGATAAAISLAALSARAERRTVLVDFSGELPVALGIDTPSDGVGDWLARANDLPDGALARLAQPIGDDLLFIARGAWQRKAEHVDRMMRELRAIGDVVIDVGLRTTPLRRAITRNAERSYITSRLCYLSLRRIVEADAAAGGVILLSEFGRVLNAHDFSSAVGAPVVATVPFDPAVARALDAGVLHAKVPRSMEKALRKIVDDRVMT